MRKSRRRKSRVKKSLRKKSRRRKSVRRFSRRKKSRRKSRRKSCRKFNKQASSRDIREKLEQELLRASSYGNSKKVKYLVAVQKRATVAAIERTRAATEAEATAFQKAKDLVVAEVAEVAEVVTRCAEGIYSATTCPGGRNCAGFATN